jgi:acetaldehyde dehydrogenase/alcohol dehydrogenase
MAVQKSAGLPANEIAALDKTVRNVKKAQQLFAAYSQTQVDAIFRAAACAAAQNRIPLAKLATEETAMGVFEDKVIKNHFAAEYIYHYYKDTPTCGTLAYDDSFGFRQVAEPVGVIAGIIPTTNPTSTVIFKALLALKTRNGIVFSPHPRAKKSTIAAAKIILEAAVKAGAPKNIIGWLEAPSMALSAALMHHPDVSLILATGGTGMVKAAYSSGTPAIGVGAGNTPAVIDATADVQMAVSSIILSKTFDNGMICASEQSVIAEAPVYEKVKKEFIKRGCYFVTGNERKKLAKTLVTDGQLNGNIVGQSAEKIAEMAGIRVPQGTKILIAETKDVGDKEPFSREKLSPVLAFYKGKNFDACADLAKRLIWYGGAGHTSVLFTDPANQAHINVFNDMPTGRTLINMPSSQGAIGDVYNFRLPPSLTLGCGTWGKNAVSENIGVKHLMNVKSVAERRENMYWYKVPQKIYFKRGALQQALPELTGKKRAYIITDKTMEELGHVKAVTDVLEKMNVRYRLFTGVLPDPTVSNVKEALAVAKKWQPDLIIALGGGSPMDEAKMVWLLYEHPETSFEGMALRFMDIRKRIYGAEKLGHKATLVAIPTTSGTGSEVTPFTIITDEKTNTKYAIGDYALLPDMAIIDPQFVLNMPKSLTAFSGLDTLTHAIEAYTSLFATPFTDPQALEAVRLVHRYLPNAYKLGAKDITAREQMHYAATIAGLAFANAFLGVCHSMAHKLGAMYHVPHGLANAFLLPYVIDYNATDKPSKQGLYPQYKYPCAKERYAQITDFVFPHNTWKSDETKVKKLIALVAELKKICQIPPSIKAYLDKNGVSEKTFLANVDKLSEMAFDDQCTGANPRYPLVKEIKEIFLKAYYGKK